MWVPEVCGGIVGKFRATLAERWTSGWILNGAQMCVGFSYDSGGIPQILNSIEVIPSVLPRIREDSGRIHEIPGVSCGAQRYHKRCQGFPEFPEDSGAILD